MAALCTGISYGLSQSCLRNENKELIFVKLTDSAYRAIEEYQKNQNKLSSHATIQFLGHDGYLSFPSLSKSGGQKFSFTVTKTEELQGSFECIQQNHNQLEVLGSLPQKMRIHANEDVYEATRHRMAVAEENQKNKCTREIKPNQTDIGRKVKVKTSIQRLSNIPTNNNATLNKRDSSSSSSSSNYVDSSSNPNSWIQLETRNAEDRNRNINSSNTINNNSIENHLTGLTTSMVTSTTASPSPIKNNLHHHHNNNISSHHNHHQYNNHQQNNNNNNHHNNNNFQNRANSRNSSSSKSYGRGNSEIVKRPIKERLIHMLALRPYKKPEIYSKISNEGVKERERGCIGTILKSLSYMRDNTYHLHRHLWNDVHDDWPFYTEQDRQTLKRRKPANLTPPLSSDGSSTSGQSPTSTHNGSPPPAVKRPPLNSDKYTSSECPTSKKQRISHYRKDIVNHQDTNIGARSKYHDFDDNMDMYRRDLDTRESSMSMKSRSRDEPSMRSSFYGPNVTPNAQESEDSGLSLGYSSTDAAKRMSSSSSSINSEQDHDRDICDDDGRDFRRHVDHGSTPSLNMINGSDGHGSGGYDFSKFTRITSVEQRRLYKTEFDKDYAEYMQLHAETERVSSRFAQLEDLLRKTDHKNPRYKEIQQQILKEYNSTMSNSMHHERKKRFDYLHHKLSHIKGLVNEFDSTIRTGQINY
ncbi:RNA polymerase II elongation factor ELL2 [Contarinia nasturtii]|uniref:RNA polymerase II elongation factor ELL2 n=1 Tax=Contarinia nasturtii TaxID=265458 RepID=UPI0012D3D604|nr:RNA polymerase II elongation factor ELL2 [Contarinia nasturtii]XP_031639066.1 RNA polymerase II elongation factor ELL2 [Contarinia nasturtii]